MTEKENNESKETKKDEVKENEAESNQFKVDAKSTLKDTKEGLKNVNIKEDAKGTTGFISGIFKNPLETLKNVVNDKSNKYFKNALFLICIWLIVILLESIFGVHWTKIYAKNNFLNIFRSLFEPIVAILAFSGIIYFMQKDSKKNLTTNITAVTTAMVPIILVKILSILELFSSDFVRIITPLNAFARAITIVFLYFTSKELLCEDNDSTFVKKFATIQLVYFVVYFIFTFLKIYIPMI